MSMAYYTGKILPEHYLPIVTGVRKVLAENPRAKAYYAENGMTPKRFRWDCFWLANAKNRDAFREAMEGIYTYGHDAHIDTLLRYIIAQYTPDEEV